MNLASYTEALTQAEAKAVEFKASYVVIYWEYDDSFTSCSLTVFTITGASAKVVASVDHEGFITESAWIKAQLEAVAA